MGDHYLTMEVARKLIEPGVLLVACPSVQGKTFNKSVILITEHHAGGTVGLVLNKTSTFTVKDVMHSHQIDYEGVEPVYVGGPVNLRALSVLHEQPRSGNTMAVGQRWVSSDRAMLHELGQGLIEGSWRVFAGVASWAQNQLAREIEQGMWLTVDSTEDLIYTTTGTAQWERCVEACAVSFVAEYFL